MSLIKLQTPGPTKRRTLERWSKTEAAGSAGQGTRMRDGGSPTLACVLGESIRFAVTLRDKFSAVSVSDLLVLTVWFSYVASTCSLSTQR